MAQEETFTAGTYKEGSQAGWPQGGPSSSSGDIDDWPDTIDGKTFDRSTLSTKAVGCGLKFTNPPHTIPATATINRARCEAYLRLFTADTISCGLFLYNTVTGGKRWENATPGFGAWAVCAQNWTRDGDGAAWGLADDMFSHVFGAAYFGGSGTCYLVFTSVRLIINFTLPTPVIETKAASAIGAGQATLNATLNPNGANATYPCSYKFKWGTDSLLEVDPQETVPIDNQIGSADIAASSTITGLVSDTIYYYQAIAYNDDVEVYGDIKRLASNAEDRFWLDEFHPLDGDLNSNKALMRWVTVGFDIGADLLDCPDADRENL